MQRVSIKSAEQGRAVRAARRAWLFLLAALAVCLPGCGQKAGEGQPQSEATWHFAVEGMSCEGCVSTVTAAIQAVPGVQSAEVSLKDKQATVRADAAQASPQAVVEAVQKAGYKATQIR